jgi:hypothetical protein
VPLLLLLPLPPLLPWLLPPLLPLPLLLLLLLWLGSYFCGWRCATLSWRRCSTNGKNFPAGGTTHAEDQHSSQNKPTCTFAATSVDFFDVTPHCFCRVSASVDHQQMQHQHPQPPAYH